MLKKILGTMDNDKEIDVEREDEDEEEEEEEFDEDEEFEEESEEEVSVSASVEADEDDDEDMDEEDDDVEEIEDVFENLRAYYRKRLAQQGEEVKKAQAEVKYWKNQYQSVYDELLSATTEVDEERKSAEEKEEVFENMMVSYYKEKLAKNDEQIKKAHDDMEYWQKLYNRANSDISNLKEDIEKDQKEVEEKDAYTQNIRTSYEQQLASKDEEIKKYLKDVEYWKDQYDKARDDLANLKDDYEREVEELEQRAQKKGSQSMKASFKAKLAKKDDEIRQYLEDIEYWKDQYDQAQDELASLKEDYESDQSEVDDEESYAESLKASYEEQLAQKDEQIKQIQQEKEYWESHYYTAYEHFEKDQKKVKEKEADTNKIKVSYEKQLAKKDQENKKSQDDIQYWKNQYQIVYKELLSLKEGGKESRKKMFSRKDGISENVRATYEKQLAQKDELLRDSQDEVQYWKNQYQTIYDEMINLQKDVKKNNKEVKQGKGKVNQDSHESTEYWKNQYYKAYADMANLRKQIEKDTQESKKYRIEGFAEQLVRTLDAFDMALKTESTNKEVNNFLIGFKYIYNQLLDTLKKEGVKIIDPKVGDKFDEDVMHCVETVEDDGEENIIKEVSTKGYKLYDHLIRAAMVVVSKKSY